MPPPVADGVAVVVLGKFVEKVLEVLKVSKELLDPLVGVQQSGLGGKGASAASTGASWPALALVSFAIFAVLYAWATFRWGVHYYVLLGYLAISGWTYVMYMHDKTAAELGEWRVSEGGLHLLGLLGGWPGANLAQHFLRHKSKKASFRVKHWVMVSLNLGAFAFMASNGMLRLEYWL